MIRMLLVGYVFTFGQSGGCARGASQSGLSLVLQAQCRGSDPRSFGVLAEPGMNASVRAMPCGECSRAWWHCIAAGLVGGEAFSVDASLIKADVDKQKRVPGASQ